MDCGSDHELLIAKFRFKLKKWEKTTGPFKYDLNQIPCHYTVEVMSRFKGLDAIECLKYYGWRLITNVKEAMIKTILKKKKWKKAKWYSEDALQVAEKRKEAKDKGERERLTQLNSKLQRIARRDKKFLSEQCKEIE